MEEKNKRILVVDDEQDLCEILSFNLETEGYHVDTANSAEEALEMDVPSYHLLLFPDGEEVEGKSRYGKYSYHLPHGS